MEPKYKVTGKGYELYVDSDGSRHWYKDGLLHREDGPAVEHSSGTKEWGINGQLHREDGPAIERLDGDKHWYLNNTEVTEEKFNEVWNCPMDRLPLYINTPLAPIAKRRLSKI